MSYFDRRYTPEYWDHERDLRKHEPRPTDRPVHRFDRPISTAMDIAVCVRAMDNLQAAAELIERYFAAKAQEQRLDAIAAGARP
jgi:hypothetical protein